MTILLEWLLDQAWIFYVACGVGCIIYLVRALTAHRERGLALFTLERETATSRAIQAWVMVLIFGAIGALIFISATFIVPELPTQDAGAISSTATLVAGVVTPTEGTPSELSPTIELILVTSVPTVDAQSTVLPPSPPTAIPPPPGPTTTPSPTLVPTSEEPPAVIGQEVHVRFGDFAELVSYDLPATHVATSQPLQLTIYWRSLEGTSQLDYAVFTHLISEDGRLIAQHDGGPAGGTRPTTEWGAGEIIVDLHAMVFEDSEFTGTARILVGLYDPSPPSPRTLTDLGTDHVVLPTVITIQP